MTRRKADYLAEMEREWAEIQAERENPLRAARAIVEKQAKDEGCWFEPQTCAEAYLQRQIRLLHAAIEGTDFLRRVDGEQTPRCKVTNNPVGTDTWAVGYECSCDPCQKMLRRALERRKE